MKLIYACITVGSMLIAAVVNPTVAQQLPSEKPVSSYYSKPADQMLVTKKKRQQPVIAGAVHNKLPSAKPDQRPMLPSRIIVERVPHQAPQTSAAIRAKLPSNNAVDMNRINKQKAKAANRPRQN